MKENRFFFLKKNMCPMWDLYILKLKNCERLYKRISRITHKVTFGTKSEIELFFCKF